MVNYFNAFGGVLVFAISAVILLYGRQINTIKESQRVEQVKDATQVNFSQKTALSTLIEAILTARHLFRPKIEVLKLFEKINIYTMFMC